MWVPQILTQLCCNADAWMAACTRPNPLPDLLLVPPLPPLRCCRDIVYGMTVLSAAGDQLEDFPQIMQIWMRRCPFTRMESQLQEKTNATWCCPCIYAEILTFAFFDGFKGSTNRGNCPVSVCLPRLVLQFTLKPTWKSTAL